MMLSPSLARIELLRRLAPGASMLAFYKAMRPDYQVNWHHKLLCEHLDALLRRDIRNLAVFMPPRAGKSEIVSRCFPAYAFGRDRNATIISCSYATPLARRNNRDVQRTMQHPIYATVYPGTKLYTKHVRTSATGTYLLNTDEFEIVESKGYYRCAGVGGSITGLGFSIGIIDDPIKGRAEAESPVVREGVWEWYQADFKTRAVREAVKILVCTRWHDDDLAGRILNGPEAPEWTVLSFPALAEHPVHPLDPREPGQSLWPWWKSESDLRQLSTESPYDFASLYQQDPRPRTGGFFATSALAYVQPEALPKMASVVRFWDLAVTGHTTSDYTACIKLGLGLDGNVYVLDVWRQRLQLPQVQERLLQFCAEDREAHGHGVRHLIEAEKAGIIALDFLLQDPRSRPYSIGKEHPKGDKEARARPVQSKIDAGKLALVRAPWNAAFVDELRGFPMGRHDDQVDALSGAYNALAASAPSSPSLHSVTRPVTTRR